MIVRTFAGLSRSCSLVLGKCQRLAYVYIRIDYRQVGGHYVSFEVEIVPRSIATNLNLFQEQQFSRNSKAFYNELLAVMSRQANDIYVDGVLTFVLEIPEGCYDHSFADLLSHVEASGRWKKRRRM